jgi:hypothetical protein
VEGIDVGGVGRGRRGDREGGDELRRVTSREGIGCSGGAGAAVEGRGRM